MSIMPLWTIHKDTKNESNSQLLPHPQATRRAVNYTQRYKKWKQFTTSHRKNCTTHALWTIHKDTKNESNSQHGYFRGNLKFCCELYTKIQKMKAIHNWLLQMLILRMAVNYTQRYKKWKQFTTVKPTTMRLRSLWTIHKDTKNESNSQQRTRVPLHYRGCELYTKIQKMKAIHNSRGSQ